LFQNLISNAIKYQRPNVAPVIRIAAKAIGKEWLFSVKDNSQGIALEYVRLIFEPLKRLHGGRVPGSGLGLAICTTIVERHGGTIWVESPGQDCGSTFCFTLPAGTS